MIKYDNLLENSAKYGIIILYKVSKIACLDGIWDDNKEGKKRSRKKHKFFSRVHRDKT